MRHHIALTLSIAYALLPACKSMNQASQAKDDGQATKVEPRLDTSYRSLLGVRPDCSEDPVSYADLIRLANDPGVKNQQDFLERIPKGAMQTFTLMYESQSAQSPGIDENFPGAIRMTQNGHLAFRFICKSQDEDGKPIQQFNKVEFLRYETGAERFVLSEFDFTQGPGKRVKEEPDTCNRCHQVNKTANDPRPNWAMYPDWEGIFGSHDDFFPLGKADEVAQVVHYVDPKDPSRSWHTPNNDFELTMYENFLKAKVIADPAKGVKPDPCYATLPWPKQHLKGEKVPDLYRYYPYGTYNARARQRIYALRPNLKLSEIYSHLLGRRNFRKLSRQNAAYDSVKRLLAVEGARCLDRKFKQASMSSQDFHRYMAEALPGYKRQAITDVTVTLRGLPAPHHDPRHESGMAQGLYSASLLMGFMPGDWTLSFQPDHPGYETGAGPGNIVDFAGDLPLTAYVQHEILADVVKSSQLKTTDKRPLDSLWQRSVGESADFGQHFACIDENAGGIEFKSDDDQSALCDTLIQEALSYREKGVKKP